MPPPSKKLPVKELIILHGSVLCSSEPSPVIEEERVKEVSYYHEYVTQLDQWLNSAVRVTNANVQVYEDHRLITVSDSLRERFTLHDGCQLAPTGLMMEVVGEECCGEKMYSSCSPTASEDPVCCNNKRQVAFLSFEVTS